MTVGVELAELSGSEVVGRRFESVSTDDHAVVDAYFEDCTFVRCELARLVLRECQLVGCRFEDCDLSLMQPTETKFEDTTFTRCRVMGVDWTQARWSNFGLGGLVAFDQCDLESSSFIGLELPDLSVIESKLRGVDFSDAQLCRSDFTRSDLLGTIFNGTDLREADLATATGYAIDHRHNRLARARFSLPEAAALLDPLDIVLVDPPEAPA